MELPMSPVADDFAAIARRLKEIQAEVAMEAAAARKKPPCDKDCSHYSHEAYDEVAGCA
jgi:hypothetical protein